MNEDHHLVSRWDQYMSSHEDATLETATPMVPLSIVKAYLATTNLAPHCEELVNSPLKSDTKSWKMKHTL